MIELKNKAPEIIATKPDSKEEILLKKGRFGPYVQCGDKMKSLPPNVEMEDVDEKLAINLVGLPSIIGNWGDDNQDIKLDIGKFGPYIRCGKETRSIPETIKMFELSEEQAIELLKEGKKKREPKIVKDLTNGIEIREGRYGMYITDGKTNVKMPNGITSNDLTLEEAQKLIKEKKANPKKRFKKKK